MHDEVSHSGREVMIVRREIIHVTIRPTSVADDHEVSVLWNTPSFKKQLDLVAFRRDGYAVSERLRQPGDASAQQVVFRTERFGAQRRERQSFPEGLPRRECAVQNF